DCVITDSQTSNRLNSRTEIQTYFYFFDCCFHFLLPLFLVDFSSDLRTSSIDLKCCCFGFKASNISSNPPTTDSIFKNESKEMTPFCSNFLNVDKGTPDLSDKPSWVSSICNLRSRMFSTIFICTFDNDINNIIVVFKLIMSKQLLL